MQVKTGYRNLLHGSDFLCHELFLIMNYYKSFLIMNY